MTNDTTLTRQCEEQYQTAALPWIADFPESPEFLDVLNVWMPVIPKSAAFLNLYTPGCTWKPAFERVLDRDNK